MNNLAMAEYLRDTPRTANVPVMPSASRLKGAGEAAGRRGFGSWLDYSCKVCFNQAWLDYQFQRASRYTPALKETYKVVAAADHLPLRYMITLICLKAAPIKPFQSRKGISAEEVETLHQAWSKAIYWPLAPGGGPHGHVK